MNPTPASSEVTPDSPWLGLRSYGEGDATHFFGREKELADLRDRVLHKPLTILFGQSGWGKTSLLQAGLVPQLRKDDFLPVIIRLVHDESAGSLEAQVIGALAKALKDSGCGKAAADVSATLAQGGAANLWLLLHDPVFGLSGADSSIPPPVFIFDQFEEMFTLGDKPERRAATLAFRDVLASLVENRPNATVRQRIAQDDELADRINYQARSYRVLVALRYDFLHLLERWRKQMPSLMDNRMELRLLAGPQAFEAVVRPGQKRPGQPPIIPDEVGRAIVRFVAGVGPDVPLVEIDAVPPLLSLICSELNSQRQALGLDQISQSQFEGSGAEILNSFYERSFDPATYGSSLEAVPLGGDTLHALRRLIEDRLLSAEGFRESIAFDTMLWELSGQADADTAKKVLALLVERRLLSVDERGGVQRLELTHDVLTRVARTSREARKEKEALEKARLDQERTEAEKQKALAEKNRLRKFALAAAACAIAAIIAAVFGWIGMQRAREAAEDARKQEAEANTQREQARKQEAEAKQRQKEADSAFGTARSTLDAFLSKVEESDLAYISGIQSLRQDLAKKAAEQFATLRQQRPNDKAVLLGLLKAKSSQALIATQVSSYDEAVQLCEDCLREINSALKDDGNNQELLLLGVETEIPYGRFLYLNNERNGLTGRYESIIARVQKVIDSGLMRRKLMAEAKAWNMHGNALDDRLLKIESYKKARHVARLVLDTSGSDAETLMVMAAPTWNLGDSLQKTQNQQEKEASSVLYEEAEKLEKEALHLRPHSPHFLFNKTMTLQMKAKRLIASDKVKEGNLLYEQAMQEARVLASNNPLVTYYQWNLADGLINYAGSLNVQGRIEEARTRYEEALQILKKLVTQVDDRPVYATKLLNLYSTMANFESFGTSKNDGNKLATILAAYKGSGESLSLRSQAIKQGHELVQKYPRSLEIRDILADLIYSNVSSLPAEKSLQALDEVISILMAEEVRTNTATDTDWFNTLFGAISLALQNLDSIKEKGSKVANGRPATGASPIPPPTQTSQPSPELVLKQKKLMDTAIQALDQVTMLQSGAECEKASEIVQRYARHLEESGDLQKAVQAHEKMIGLLEVFLKSQRWFFYHRNTLSIHYRALATILQKQGPDVRAKEVDMRTRYMRIWGVPLIGLSPELIESPLLSDERLQSLRKAMDSAKMPPYITMKCPVGASILDVQFYTSAIPVGDKGDEFLNDQLRWLKENRGVDITVESKKALELAVTEAQKNKTSLRGNFQGYREPASSAIVRTGNENKRITVPKMENYIDWLSAIPSMLPPQPGSFITSAPAGAAVMVEAIVEMAPTSKDSVQLQRINLAAIGRARRLTAEGKNKEALELLKKYQDSTTAVLKQEPYRWPLKQSLAELRAAMLPLHASLGNTTAQKELAILWLSEWGIPLLGVPASSLTSLETETPEAYLTRITGIVAAPKAQMKRFTIPSELNGYLVPAPVFISDAIPDERGPAMFNEQVRWFKEEYGVLIPFDVRESLKKLADIAKDNNVSLVDLCTYALNYPTDNSTPTSTPTQSSSSATSKAKTPPPPPPPPSSALPDPPSLDARMTDVKEARAELAKAPSDKLRFNLAGNLGGAAFAAVFQKRYQDAVAWSREALELIAACKPDYDPERRAGMVFIYGNLAHALLFQGKYDEAIKMYKDHWNAPMLRRIFKDEVVEDFAMLEQAGIGKEEMARARKDLGLLEAAPASPAKDGRPPRPPK